MSKDEVASFDFLVAGKAGLERRLVGRFAILKVSVPPAARGGVLRRNVTSGQPDNNCAVRERQLFFPKSLDR
jgi:hypothetical protein